MLRRLALTCAAVLLAAAATGPSYAAGRTQAPAKADPVTVNQKFTVPANGRFTIAGHGFGHGHGMSQYGAYGAAKQGKSASAILAFYYPGTRVETTTGRTLKVQVSADTNADVVVRAAKGQRVRDYGAKKAYALPDDLGATMWRLTVSGTKSVVQYWSAKAWHAWKPGGQATLVGDGGFQSTTGQNTLVLPGGATRTYRGTLLGASPSAGSATRVTVNLVALDDYTKGVVAAEMPASWTPAALQSQAVAARTYATWQAQTPRTTYYDICDTTACQVYGGVDSEAAGSTKAVEATAGKILTYQKKPAFTQFSSSSGGWTSAGSVPYLPHKADPYDDHSANPVHSWTRIVDKSGIERANPSIGTLRSITVTKREGDGDWGGRVLSLTLTGTKATKTVTGDALRGVYTLRSTWFTFKAS